MLKKTGFFVSSFGAPVGALAVVLYIANLTVWSILAAMLGGSFAMIGLGLILWALYPVRAEQQVEQDEMPVDAMPEAA